MFSYLTKRILSGILTLFLVMGLLYGLIRAMPGSPITLMLSESSQDFEMSEEQRQRYMEKFHLDKKWYVAYFYWVGDALRGDFGDSFSLNKKVSEAVGEAVVPTLYLSVTSLFLMYLFSIPIGLYCARRSGKVDERAISTLLYIFYSVPSFAAALLLLTFFSLKLQGTAWELPLFGMESISRRGEMPFATPQTGSGLLTDCGI